MGRNFNNQQSEFINLRFRFGNVQLGEAVNID